MKQSLAKFWPALLLDLLAIATAFIAAGRLLLPPLEEAAGAFLPDQYGMWLVVSVLTFWIAAQLQAAGDADDTALGWLRLILLGSGLNFLGQGLLAYALLLVQPIPPLVLVAGSLLAALLLFLERRWIVPRQPQPNQGVVILGFHPLVRALCPRMRQVLGVLEDDPAVVPPELPYLGGEAMLAQVVAERRPRMVLLAAPDWQEKIAPELLVDMRLSGIVLETLAGLYERTFQRVCWDLLDPREFLFSSWSIASRQAVLGQAAYSNLAGLVLLVVFLPVLLIIATVVRLFGGRGPILETTDCMGFRGIPFSRMRFRTRRMDGCGGETLVGSALRKSRLAALPQIMNVVRGEMAFIGPQPARFAFAERLIELIPAYRQRFSLIPGCLSWAQVHLRSDAAASDEFARLEYDLYHVKETSLAFQAEVLAVGLHFTSRSPQVGA